MISADLSGIGAFIGAVEGTLNAVEEPDFKGDFIGSLTNKIKKTFMLDAIAAKESGLTSLNHMFEWGDSQGEVSNIPLFAITRKKAGPTAMNVSFKFLPSTKPVPLPDPARYGFNPDKLKFLSRHVFYMKAIVMETQSSVVINPRGKRGLFIPTTQSKKGYIMYRNSTTINPGGSEATGGFAQFWSSWFESRGEAMASEFSSKFEQELGATGRKAVRYAAGTVVNGKKVGGQFATGTGVSINYVNAKAVSAEAYVNRLLRAQFRDGRDLGD